MTVCSYKLWLCDHYVTARVRETILSQYPGLLKDPGHMWLMNYICYGTWYDENADDSATSRLVIPREYLWQMYSRHRGHRSVEDIFASFEEDTGISLSTVIGSHTSGSSTTINPELDPDVIEALKDDQHAETGLRNTKFIAGTLRTVKGTAADKTIRKKLLQQLAIDAMQGLDPTHARTKLLGLLNNQNQDHLGILFAKGLPVCMKLAARMPEDTPRQLLSKRHVQRTLRAIENSPGMVYQPKDRTLRIYSVGPTVDKLPRLFRKLLLAYTAPYGRVVDFDLKSAQWAINARRWKCDKNCDFLEQCLAEDLSVWDELLHYCMLPSDKKTILKDVIYSLTYGMAVKKLKKIFVEGNPDTREHIDGVGDPKKWTLLRSHPCVKELFDARKQRFARSEGEADAYGEWCQSNKGNKYDPLSTESLLAQSYEQRIMHSLIPILEKDKRLVVLSYLHDGLTIYFSDKKAQKGRIKSIKNAVSNEAQSLQIPTALEETVLNPEAIERELIAYYGIVL